MLIAFAALWLITAFLVGKLIRGTLSNNQYSFRIGFILIGISFALGATLLMVILFNL